MKTSSLLAPLVFIISCTPKNDLEVVLSSPSENIQLVMKDPERYEVQILYTQIHRDDHGQPSFVEHAFNVDDQHYFYPASTVKLPISILALEKLERLQQDNPVINAQSPFKTANDSTYTTIEKALTKIFAVSDNEAYNTLFEFLGQDAINDGLTSKNLTACITHRLSAENASDLKTKEITFKNNPIDTGYLYQEPSKRNKPLPPLQLDKLQKGKGYMAKGSLIEKPMDFSRKNYLPLCTLHQIMKRIHFPESVPQNERFMLTDTHLQLLKNAMKTLPKEAGYDPAEYYDGYVKFFVIGDQKEKIPPSLRIYNKVGYAYGYLTDSAYIKDEQSNVEFLLSATIHVNQNEVFNDDMYEYDSIGIPFLATLGRKIYQLEMDRK